MIRYPTFITFLLLTYQLVVQLPTTVSIPVILPQEKPPDCVNGPCLQRCLHDIVVGCLTTTVICAWTAVHPNIPHRPLNGFLRRLQLMFWTVVAPEVLPSWALNQLLAAMTVRNIYNEAKGHVKGSSGIWETVKEWVSMEHTTGVGQAWTLWHGHFLIMGGFHLIEPDGATLPRATAMRAQTTGNVQATNASSLDSHKERGQIYLPAGVETKQDEIMDKSKGDALSKFIFIVQTSWFIVQCMGRQVQGLDLTELELTTLALASLNWITTLLWWNKPLDALTPIRVYLRKPLTRKLRPQPSLGEKITIWPVGRFGFIAVTLGVIANSCGGYIFVAGLVLLLPLTVLLSLFALIVAFTELGLNTISDLLLSPRVPAENIDDATQSPTFYVPKHQYSENWHFFLLVVLGSIFGAIHCAGWNFPFPTYAYRLLWRITSLIVAVVPIAVPASILIALVIRNLKNAVLRESTRFELPSLYDVATIPQFVGALFGLIYIAARLILLGLALVLLRDQPPSAFIDVDWTKYYPHF